MIEVNNYWYLKWDPIITFLSFISLKTPQINQGNIIFCWYKVLAYAGLEVIKHFEKHTDRARVKDPKEVLKIINCELYLILKVKHLISRRTGNKKPIIKPFEWVTFDLILMEEVYNSNKWISYLYYILIKMNLLDIYKFKGECNNILKRFINIIKIKFGYIIKFIRTDNKQLFKGRYWDFFAAIKITLEWTALYSPQQNGSAEYSGGVLIMKAWYIHALAGLLVILWPEVFWVIIYLLN